MSSSPIDSLPLDTLVQVLCKLSHDELKPLLTVSRTFHNAALAAQHSHFDYSTPQRSKTSAFDRSKDREPTPDAPLLKMGSRKPRVSKLSEEDTRRVAAVLFRAGDCKRRLAFRPAWRACSLPTKREGSAVRVSNAHA
ncbi:F-box protein At1g61340-like [Ananas comosus]|uniref:F-box protein At1g61340-like n=1 Tax=Ananas comosus TaxID=4615 RepID=A0A6P5FC71_ANACO|nr:F-box protein At1g61340-like [Ananas comosus]